MLGAFFWITWTFCTSTDRMNSSYSVFQTGTFWMDGLTSRTLHRTNRRRSLTKNQTNTAVIRNSWKKMDVGNAGSIQTEHLSCLRLTVNKEGGGVGGGGTINSCTVTA